MDQKLQLAACGVGIMASLVAYSILQERIMTVSFGTNQERFTWSVFLVLCNRLTTTTLAAGVLSFSLCLQAQQRPLAPAAPLTSYAAVSFSNVVATCCQYEALKYVTFPVQTLGKCAKMIPVMVWGTLISRKSYSAKDYTAALLVTSGCTVFLLNRGAEAKASRESSLLGGVLMLTYLAFDGFTSTFQDKLFKGYQMSVFNQMLYVNLCSALASFAGLVGSGQLWQALAFVGRHPEALLLMLLLSAAATLGASAPLYFMDVLPTSCQNIPCQVLIVHTIRRFGALAFATIMTSRQFVSVLASCLIFAHPLSLGQWCGTTLVFGGLYYMAFSRQAGSTSSKSH